MSACGELFASAILRKQGSMHLDEAGNLVVTLGIPWLQPGVDVNPKLNKEPEDREVLWSLFFCLFQ